MINMIRRHSAVAYFLLTFFISWFGAFLLVARRLLHAESIPKFTGLMMFPVMLFGPFLTALILTAVLDGPAGLRDLFRRITCWQIRPRFCAVFFIPPLFVLAVLVCLSAFVSPAFAPSRFLPGIGFGVAAGLLEEIGWTGFAFPKMVVGRKRWLLPALLLGILWTCWHLPVIDYLGAATPHGSAWLSFFLAFAAAMTAIRVLICWLYLRTESVLAAQLMHAFSTASLVVFSPAAVSPSDEAFWYSIYAIALWLLILVLLATKLLTPAQIPRE